jgi:hypothetical protein
MKHIDSSLYPLLLTLFDRDSEIWNSIMKYYWKVCLGSSKWKEYQPGVLPDNIQITTKYAFGILYDDFLKIEFKEKLSLENYDKFSNEHDRTINECWNMYLDSDERDDVNKIKDTFKHLKILLFNSYKDILCELFREVKKVMDDVSPDDYQISEYNTIKWRIRINDVKIVMQVLKKIGDSSEWSLICKRIEKNNFGKGRLLGTRLIENNDIVILTTIGLFIYYFNEYNISLIYFYYMDLNNSDILLQDYEKLFSGITLPSPNYDSFKLNKWALSLADNKLSLLKYGVELFEFAIKEHNLELVEDIYKNCMNYFKQDLRNNRIFLSIITSAMPLLKKHFPKYIERYSLETDLIIDSPSYSIDDDICSQMVNSINLTGPNLRKLNKKSSKGISHSPEITFMVPYIKFVNYPKDYNWRIELLLPKPSLFVETMSKDNYKSLNGIALIMFKWHSFGAAYYIVIMVGHLILFTSFYFVAVADMQIQEIRGETRVAFLWASIILGFFHLFFVFRQFVYKMIRNPLKKLFVKSGLIFGIKF